MSSADNMDIRTVKPSKDYFDLLKLPDEVRARILYFCCPEARVYPWVDGSGNTIIMRNNEERTVSGPSSTTPHQAAPPSILMVSKQVCTEVQDILYSQSTHVLPPLGLLVPYLQVMKPRTKIFSSIKKFEVGFAASDLSPYFSSELLGGPLPSSAGGQIRKLVRPRERILFGPTWMDGPGCNDREVWTQHTKAIKDLLKSWEFKKAFLWEVIGPKRIILRLDEAICPGGCHRLHRCVLYDWMLSNSRLPAGLKVIGLPPGEDLDDFETEMRWSL